MASDEFLVPIDSLIIIFLNVRMEKASHHKSIDKPSAGTTRPPV
jgi:hypothetical protein